MAEEYVPLLIPKEQPNFVATPQVEGIVKRAIGYIRAGFPIHLTGPTGCGKTTLALYVAGQIGRPVVVIHGDEELATSDLVGGEHGYRMKKVVDNFIHSVMKTEEKLSAEWLDNRVTVACKNGFTLFYDEFTRSRPEANNVLLSVFEEKILDLPAAREGEESHLRVHPDFSAIFTSNPEEYAGVHTAQDALRDRMITIKLGHYDRETEIAITQAKSGVTRPYAESIVDIVRGLREMKKFKPTPTVRACVMIAKSLSPFGAQPVASDKNFAQACFDVLISQMVDETKEAELRKVVTELIKKYC